MLDVIPRFGSIALRAQGRAILVDGTHGTNKYKFCLTTVMVIDDNNRAIPVWAQRPGRSRPAGRRRRRSRRAAQPVRAEMCFSGARCRSLPSARP